MPGHITSQDNWRSVCRVADLSCHGARLATFSALTKGTIVWINLPDQPARKGEIVWADEYSAACRFLVPLEECAVTALVGRYGFEVEPDRQLEAMIMVA